MGCRKQIGRRGRELLQNSVAGNDLNQTVGIGWPGDPALGTVKDLTVSYWDGSQIQTWHGKDGATLALHALKSSINSDLEKYRKEYGEGLIVLERDGELEIISRTCESSCRIRLPTTLST